jgi:hypothetical protein
MDRKKKIIDMEPNVTIATTKVQLEVPKDSKEGECLFYSWMWVKGTLIHFIVDNKIQKTIISAKVINVGNVLYYLNLLD